MAVQMSGLTGTRALKMSDVTAPALIAYTPQFGNRKVRNMHDWLKPLPVPPEALLVNRGGQRGVLPCGDAWGYSKVIRRPAGNKFTGLYPQTGWARNQEKGLAFSEEKPINLPIMPLPSSVYAGVNSKIPGRF